MRLIDAEALDEQIWNIKAEWGNDNLSLINQGEVSDLICEATPIEERVEGEWEALNGLFTPGGDPAYICSICHNPKSQHINGIESPTQWDYCPCCGAKMKYVYK